MQAPHPPVLVGGLGARRTPRLAATYADEFNLPFVDEATTRLLALGVGDGLPVVPPTPERWERMLDGITAPDEVLGLVPPLFGELTARVVAGCCVLAGCRPGVVPLVLTAAVLKLTGWVPA